jgi:hypothetical protein
MTDAPTDKKLSERFAMIVEASNQIPGAWVTERIDDDGGIEQAIFIGPRAQERAFAYSRLAESHPSAIREAVEGEREACAKLVAAYGIAGMPFDVGSWTPGAVAAAIRARGEEKGK